MKKFALIVTIITVLIISLLTIGVYNYLDSPVGGNKVIQIEVKEGDSFNTLEQKLIDNKLIKSPVFYKIKLKLKGVHKLETGLYEVNTNMKTSEIIDILSGKPNAKPVRITFKEGRNMRYIASTISKNLNITEDEVFAKLNDKKYLESIKKEYWFIEDDIENKEIYYSLEGYLYPDTYEISPSASIEEVFEKMLDNMESKLNVYKKEIQNSTYSVHQLLTLASMIELEATTEADRQGVASVFYNRLKSNMSLGSDVTTYYAAKVDMGERDLYKSELNDYNAYNTRNSKMAGKLPVGPICNPSLTSIKATLYPSITSNYYFVADKNKKVYFTKNSKEHDAIITKLKKEGLWYTY